MRQRCALVTALLLLATCVFAEPAAPTPRPPLASETAAITILRATTDKSFADVIQELDFAITEHNYRITGRNTIGKALRKRGYEGFPDVEVILFCSVEQAREVLLLDPGYVALMPCKATVHEEGAQTVISLNLLPETHPDPRVVAFAQRVNGVMREILSFVLERPVP